MGLEKELFVYLHRPQSGEQRLLIIQQRVNIKTESSAEKIRFVRKVSTLRKPCTSFPLRFLTAKFVLPVWAEPLIQCELLRLLHRETVFLRSWEALVQSDAITSEILLCKHTQPKDYLWWKHMAKTWTLWNTVRTIDQLHLLFCTKKKQHEGDVPSDKCWLCWLDKSTDKTKSFNMIQPFNTSLC